MAMIPSICAKSSTLYNPFLYGYKDVRLQRAIRKYILQHTSAVHEKTVSATAGTRTLDNNKMDRMDRMDSVDTFWIFQHSHSIYKGHTEVAVSMCLCETDQPARAWWECANWSIFVP